MGGAARQTHAAMSLGVAEGGGVSVSQGESAFGLVTTSQDGEGGGFRRKGRHHFQTHLLPAEGVRPEFVVTVLGAVDVEDAVAKLQQLKPQQLRVRAAGCRDAEPRPAALSLGAPSARGAPPHASHRALPLRTLPLLQAAFQQVYKSPTTSENKKWLQRRLAEGAWAPGGLGRGRGSRLAAWLPGCACRGRPPDLPGPTPSPPPPPRLQLSS